MTLGVSMTYFWPFASKRFCPECAGRMKRQPLPAVGGFLQQAVLIVPAVFLFVVIGGIMQSFGWSEARLPWLIAGLVTVIAFAPLLNRTLHFKCGVCGHEAPLAETLPKPPNCNSSGRAEARRSTNR
jgi:hypothetical protein